MDNGHLIDLVGHKARTIAQLATHLDSVLAEAGIARLAAVYSSAAMSQPDAEEWSVSGEPDTKRVLYRRFAASSGFPDELVPDQPHPKLPKSLARADIDFGQTQPGASTLFLLEKFNDEPLPQSLAESMRLSYERHLEIARSRNRDILTRLSLNSKDVNSFSHKVLERIVSQELGFARALVFIQKPRRDFLELSARHGMRTDLTKEHIRIFPMGEEDEEDLAYRLFQRSHHLFLRHQAGFMRSFLSARAFQTNKIRFGWHRFVPLATAHAVGAHADEESNRAGLLWVGCDAQVERRGHLGQFAPAISWEDHYLLDGLADEMAFRSLIYRRSDLVDIEFDRILHGINADIVTAKQNLSTIHEQVFVSLTHPLGSPPTMKLSEAERRIRQLKQKLETSIAMIDDLDFQVRMTQRDHYEQEDDSEAVCTQLFSQVLQKVVNLAPAIARVHSRKDPKISSLKDVGAETLPAVVGSEAGLISVFRNLVENAIKYTPREHHPTIDVWFEVDRDTLAVHLRDYGIGVPETEQDKIFKEGFRGAEARRNSFRGSGVGLAYCRRTLERYKARVSYEPAFPGSEFVVKLRVSQRHGG